MLKNVSKEKFIEAIKNSRSIRQVIRNLGLNDKSSHYSKEVKLSAVQWNVDVSSLLGQGCQKGISKVKKESYTNEEVFKENSNYLCISHLKKRLLKYNLLPYKCAGENCLISSEWLGKPISLTLDHVNGVNTDHRLENLQFLCPNCHSQTETFCGKNIAKGRLQKFCKTCKIKISISAVQCHNCSIVTKVESRRKKLGQKVFKIIWPDYQDLVEEVNKTSYAATAKRLGVSDSSVRKHLLAGMLNL